MTSTVNLGKQFGPRSGPTNLRAWSGSKLFDILMVFLEEVFSKGQFWKKSADNKKHRKLPSMQWVKNRFSRTINNCLMLALQHTAIFSTFIKLPFVCKTFCLSICEWPLKTGLTVVCVIAQMIYAFVVVLHAKCRFFVWCNSDTIVTQCLPLDQFHYIHIYTYAYLMIIRDNFCQIS